MSIEEDIKELFEQCVNVSKEFVVKTGEKAKDLGERSMLMLDIKQTESKIQKLMCKLGEEVYRAFMEKEIAVIQYDDFIVERILKEIAVQKESLNKMKTELLDR